MENRNSINIGEKFSSREEMEKIYTWIVENVDPHTKWTFGYKLTGQFFYRFEKFEFIQDPNEVVSCYICVRTPNSEMDLEQQRHYTVSLHSKEARKSPNYYKRYDAQSRGARRAQEKGWKETYK